MSDFNTYFVPIMAAYFGSLGFAIFLKIRGKQIAYAGFGGAMTWGVYLIAFQELQSYFWASFLAAVFVAFFAEVMARVNKAPATIFLTAAAVPMIPGASLYYMMFGIIGEDYASAAMYGQRAAIIALAIGLGFVTVAVFMKYVYRFMWARKMRKSLQDKS